MACSPKLLIKKYFGSTSIHQTMATLDEANSYLSYFWTTDGGSNIIVSIDGQQIHSYDELVSVANQERYKNNAFIEVGIFLSNKGHDSIWPKR